jgi:hypothetical protein
MTRPNDLPSSPIRCQARPKPAAMPLVLHERLERTWYNVSSGPWRASDLPRVEIVRLDLGHVVVDLPRAWFEFRDVEERRIFLDRQVRPWKAGTAIELGRDPQSPTPMLGLGLFFDGSAKIRYLPTYPPDWHDMSDEQLLELLERAVAIQ